MYLGVMLGVLLYAFQDTRQTNLCTAVFLQRLPPVLGSYSALPGSRCLDKGGRLLKRGFPSCTGECKEKQPKIPADLTAGPAGRAGREGTAAPPGGALRPLLGHNPGTRRHTGRCPRWQRRMNPPRLPAPAFPPPPTAGAPRALPAGPGPGPHLAGGGGQPHHAEEPAEREGGEGGDAPDEEEGGGQRLAAAEGGVAQPGDADDALQADGREGEDDDGAAEAHHVEEHVADDVAQHPGLGPAHHGDEGDGGDEEQVGAEEVEDQAVGSAQPVLLSYQQADAPDVSCQGQQENAGQGGRLADAQGRHVAAPEV